ncbi:Hypothetical predicted protein [Paramuricea clavata]|uniref:Uncharacterized protein n=1 Tax=Paramuricea clavata TaxID=317549 RepID=A0A6S7FXU1_PARCT|nr:Hypothetical predicted protein [Paramuricea clavata]
MKGTLSFQSSTIEQDTEFSHIDTVLSSLAPNTSSSTENELPGSLPVPLLADFGHFEKQDPEYILVESNDENPDDTKTNSNDNIPRTSETSARDNDNAGESVEGRSVERGSVEDVNETAKEEIDGQQHAENVVDSGTT